MVWPIPVSSRTDKCVQAIYKHFIGKNVEELLAHLRSQGFKAPIGPYPFKHESIPFSWWVWGN